MAILILTVSLSVLLSALCSLLESVLYSTRITTLEAAAAGEQKAAQAMLGLKAKIERPLAAILILNTVANTAGAAVAGWAAGQVWGGGSLWIFSLGFTLCILIFSEIMPKTVGAVHWRRLWRFAAMPLKTMVQGLLPFIWLTQAITRLVTRSRLDGPRISEEEILAAARLGAQGGQISLLEQGLIQNIILLEEIRAKDIMTPRTVMVAADGAMPLSQAREEARLWGHSRVPVFEGGPEEIIGYVLTNEVLIARFEPGLDPLLKHMVKPVRFVPGSANALNLLKSFLRGREHLYLVVDEYGGIMGLVSLEDVLESLVGSEIVDEKDTVADLQEMARRRGRTMLDKEKSD